LIRHNYDLILMGDDLRPIGALLLDVSLALERPDLLLCLSYRSVFYFRRNPKPKSVHNDLLCRL